MTSTTKPEPHGDHDGGSAKPDARIYREPCQLVRIVVVGFWPFGDDIRCLIEDIGRQDHDAVKLARDADGDNSSSRSQDSTYTR